MKKYVKLLFISFIIIVFIQNYHFVVNAAVNSKYFEVTVSDYSNDKSDSNTGIMGKIGSKIMQYIAEFIFVLGNFIENTITNFSKWLFGVDVFPWEDLIVYNTLPYLDVNFFNYSDGAIFSVGSGKNSIGSIIKSIYFSLLTLSLSVLGIGVAIVAIRLAISTIAAEKAKYKEAITKCLYTVVMLFSVHIFISFIFYLNEAITVSASDMLVSLTGDVAIKSSIVNNALDIVFKNNISDTASNGFMSFGEKKDWGDTAANAARDTAKSAYKTLKKNDYYKKKVKRLADYLCSQVTFLNTLTFPVRIPPAIINKDGKDKSDGHIYNDKSDQNSWWGYSDADYANSMSSLVHIFQNILLMDPELKHPYTKEQVLELIGSDVNSTGRRMIEDAIDTLINNEGSSGYGDKLVSSVANLIKEDAQRIKTNSKEDAPFISVILYSILLLQSIMLLINYIKRIFYVTLLAVLGPIVVIYDFFMSAI